jgi:hypothetical protein
MQSDLSNDGKIENTWHPIQPVAIKDCRLRLCNPGLDTRGCCPDTLKEKVGVYFSEACYSAAQLVRPGRRLEGVGP